MKPVQGQIVNGISGVLSGVAVLMAAQPAIASAKVTGVQLNPTASGVNIVIQTQGGNRPQVFSVNRGNTWTADLVNAQLTSGSFRKVNPAPGISLVTVTAIDQNSVRVSVTGQGAAPTGQVTRPEGGGLVFSLTRSNRRGTMAAIQPRSASPKNSQPANNGALRSQQPAAPLPALPNTLAQASNNAPAASNSGGIRTRQEVVPLSALPKVVAQSSTPAPNPVTPPGANPQPASPLPAFQNAAPLVPNPPITVEGRPYTSPPPVPPFAPLPLPRAVAPPIGDIAVSQTDASATVIDLGTAERVPRLVLRDASAREVLSLLARSAGLNIVYTADQPTQPGQPQPPPGQQAAADGPKVTLDVVNEPVQNVFNYVLQVAGLEASRRGNTIFVGTRLPNSARSVVIRSIRLNQVQVGVALPFLVTLGAESAVSRERQVVSAVAIPITNITQAGQGQVGQQASAGNQVQTTTEQRIEVQRVAYTDSTPILRGLQVSGDERTNTVTLVGDARKVEIAIAQLSQLDVRRRQVAVNVRVIDIDLLNFERIGTSFSFGINDTQVVNTGGIAVLNFGQQLPAITGLSSPLGSSTLGTAPTQLQGGFASGNNFSNRFFLQLQAAITNGSAKILTDPTLVVQEGQQSQVEIGEEVITNIRQNTTATESSTQITVTVEKAVAGVTLPVNVDRIDDNGFISLSIAPLVSRPQGETAISFSTGLTTVSNPITLLALRRVQSGQVRLRDGQTLLLSGIIQDQDRTTVTKVPILGDIPILGALFRRTDNESRRREVIVLLTPRILNDTDQSAFGYSYTPGVETQKLLRQNNPQR